MYHIYNEAHSEKAVAEAESKAQARSVIKADAPTRYAQVKMPSRMVAGKRYPVRIQDRNGWTLYTVWISKGESPAAAEPTIRWTMPELNASDYDSFFEALLASE